MFYEIAITPSVFQTATYGSRELCESELRGIWSNLFQSLVVRDLRSGDWYKDLWRNKTACPHLGQKTLKALKAEKRLLLAPPELKAVPSDSPSWVSEALASHRKESLAGILTCREGKAPHSDEALVCVIDRRLQGASWWTQTVVGGETRVRRNTAGYLEALKVLLRAANHLKFMDPHLDPSLHDYREFRALLKAARRDDGVQPKIEIHRVCYEGPGERRPVSNDTWQKKFRDALKEDLKAWKLDAEVVIWPDEHDRHLITNLGGIHLGNGLKINNDPKSFSTWTPLPRNTSDAVERKFDPDATKPHHRFMIVGS
jgi:hypothetical protein